MKRTVAAAAVLLATATLAAAPAALAAAPATSPSNQCNFTLSHIPTRYYIGPRIPGLLIGGSCTTTDEWAAGFRVVKSAGTGHAKLFYAGCSAANTDPNTGKCVDFWFGQGEYAPTGRWQHLQLSKTGTWRIYTFGMLAAYGPNPAPAGLNPVFPQQGTKIVAKLATRTGLHVYRRKGIAHFSVLTSAWSARYRSFEQVAGAVQIQQRTRAGWHTIHAMTTSCANRCWTYWSTHRSRRHVYRAVTLETNTRWPSTSPTQKR